MPLRPSPAVYVNRLRGSVNRDMEEAVRVGSDFTRRRIPVKTGRLKRSLRVFRYGWSVGSAGPARLYAGIVDARVRFMEQGWRVAQQVLRLRGIR